MVDEYREINIIEMLMILKSKWWIILLTSMIAIISSSIINMYYIIPVYQAETALFLGKENDKIKGIELGEFQVSNGLINDYRQMIKTRLVAEDVIEALNLNMSVGTFKSRVSVNTLKDSRLFTITFQSSDPQLAADVTNKLAEQIVKLATEVVEVENIQVIDKAIVPSYPIKPNKILNIAIATAFGLIVGILAGFILEFLDNTIKNTKDVERILGLNTLGEIPKFKEVNRRKEKENIWQDEILAVK